jgi:D-aspartate ligase
VTVLAQFTHSTPAIVLGSGVTALGVLRRLSSHRIRALVAPPDGELVADSRWFHPAPFGIEVDGKSLAAGLEALPLPQAVLLPRSDSWTRAVAALPEALHQRFLASVPSPCAIGRVVDKSMLASELASLGVPHPRTWPLACGYDLATIPDSVFKRAFLKPRDSQGFFARFGVKAMWVRSRAEALERAAELENQGFPMQLQEYVPGPP